MAKDKDDLGHRMKYYEARTKTHLQRHTYTLLRLDGKAFHTFTKGFERPYDTTLMGWMDAAARALCEQIEGARFAYVQSDEIQVLMTDFGRVDTNMWFDGEVQKIVSVSAAIATASFNSAASRWAQSVLETPHVASEARTKALTLLKNPALFDSRVWQVSRRIEAYNAFVWRQQDATKNAISMTAQAYIPHKELQGKNGNQMQEMLFQQKGINFNDLPAGFKRGRFIQKVSYQTQVEFTDKRTGETKLSPQVTRTRWDVVEPPIFTSDEGRQWLLMQIPMQD